MGDVLIHYVCISVCVKLSAIQSGSGGEDSEPPDFLGRRQHNDGDGTSGSSHGTASPDSFREAGTGSLSAGVEATHDGQVPPATATVAETNDDVIVTPQDLLAGILMNF